MFNRRKLLTSMTAIFALTLLSGKNGWAMCCSDDALLDMAEAVKFREKSPVMGTSPSADLSSYKRATPAALEFLARQGYNEVFIGLESLDRRNAEALAGWDGFFYFTNLQHLDVEAAAILASSDNAIVFEGMREIEVDVARELSRMSNLLSVSIDSLSIEVASELARQRHELDFRLKHPPSDQVLNVLSDHAGYRLHVAWARPTGILPREFSSPNQNKKVFVLPSYIEGSGEWIENIYIGNADFYPDSLVSEDGVITLL